MSEQQIKLNASPEKMQGAYANLMSVNNTKEEFILDFFLISPPTGSLVSRLVMSPGHLKRTIKALQNNLEKYEKSHGVVTEPEAPEKPVFGFQAE